MRTKAFLSATTACIALCVTAAPANAIWKHIDDRYLPGAPPGQSAYCIDALLGVPVAEAHADVASIGGLASGDGFAWSTVFDCDAMANNKAVGVHIRAWQFQADAVCAEGFVRCTTSVSAKGSVTLKHGECAAAAVGYAQASTSLTTPITAELLKSAAETKASTLVGLSLEIEGIGAQIPLIISLGLGNYPDEDQDADVGHACTSFFKLKRKSCAEIHTWAKRPFLSLSPADCDGSMWAKSVIVFDLCCC